MEPLQIPAVRNKFRCKVFQQFRMCRPIALRTKITWCSHQSRIEMLIPDAVHENPRHKSRRMHEHCISQLGSSAAVCERGGRFRLQHCQKSTRNNVAGIRGIAPSEHRQVARFRFAIFQPRSVFTVGLNVNAGFSKNMRPRLIDMWRRSANFCNGLPDFFRLG